MKDILWAAWPWIGFGGGIALFILLFFSDCNRNDLTKSRWKDPVWLSWAMADAYLFHVAEEYGIHFHNGQYDLIETFMERGISDIFGGIPLAFFPYVNIMATWVAFPVAAVIAKKHPVIGLSTSGFVLVNGLTHIGSMRMMGLSANYGIVTGILMFIPLFIWFVIVCKREMILPSKGPGIAIAGGVIGHIGLFSLYIANKFIGTTFVYFCVPVVAFLSIIAAWILCRIFRVDDRIHMGERDVKK